MKRFDEIAAIRHNARLHLSGEEEQAFLLSEGFVDLDEVIARRRVLRQTLRKRERSHHQYLRNREQRLQKARRRNASRAQAYQKMSPEDREVVREAHRLAQGAYRARQRYYASQP